jgi:hypothetical protein
MRQHQPACTRRLGLEFDSLDDEDYVGTLTAASGIGRHAETLRRWRQDRKFLAFTQVGAGEVLYRVGDLREFLKASRVEPVDLASE